MVTPEEIIDFPEVRDEDGLHLLFITTADRRVLALNFDTPTRRDDFCVRYPWRQLKAMSRDEIRDAVYAFLDTEPD